MAKSRINGIDELFRNTEEKPVRSKASKVDVEKLVLINFQIPLSLKKKINLYCIENDISLRNFLTGLINKCLNENKK
jgi:hypothetical protein